MRTKEVRQRLGCTEIWLHRYADLVGNEDPHPGSGNYREWTEDQVEQLEKIHDLMGCFDSHIHAERTIGARSQVVRYQVPQALMAQWIEPGPWVGEYGNHRITVTVERIDHGI